MDEEKADLKSRIDLLGKLCLRQCEQFDCDEYNHGMANGLLLAVAVLAGKEPALLVRPGAKS